MQFMFFNLVWIAKAWSLILRKTIEGPDAYQNLALVLFQQEKKVQCAK